MPKKLVCRKGFEIKPYCSAAGWYLGTRDAMGFPQCRISGYAKTEDDAWNLRFEREYAEENRYCHLNNGCLKGEEND